jgi:hypothetical protein
MSGPPRAASAAPARRIGEVTNPVLRQRMRQLTLFAAMLISGGLLIFPREPVLVIVLALSFLLVNPLRLFRTEFLLIWLLLLLVAGAVLLGGGSFQLDSMAVRYANFVAGIALLSVYIGERRSTLADDLYPILKAMSFQAVLTPVMVIVFAGSVWTFQTDETVYNTLFYVFTYHELQETGALIKRPDGFFFEPGVFQIYLNIFLFITLFVRQRSRFDIALATAAVIATQSTTGAIILVLQFAWAYLTWVHKADRFAKLWVFVVAPLVLLPLSAYTVYNVTQKFYGEQWGSAEARQYDLRTGVNVALEKPLTGIGFDYEKYFDVAERVGYREARLSNDNITERANTNGIVVLLFSVGIPLALVFLLGIFSQRLFRPGPLMGLLVLLSLVSESLSLTPIFLMFAFSGLLIRPRRVVAKLPAPVRRASAA